MAYSSNLLFFLPLLLATSALAKRGLFAEYIGAENSVKFSDVPINSNVDFHFIVSFAIDYTHSGSNPTPTNGHFSAFWDTDSLSSTQVAQIKRKHPNVKVAVSLGGATVANSNVYFHPNSVDSWVNNAVSSLTAMIKKYHFDGIDIDYENFKSTPSKFADCIGRLITTLKKNRVISFASIAPYNDDTDQSNFSELWKRYGSHIDYVNYQFYSFSKHTTVPHFLQHFRTLSSQYDGKKLLASFSTDNSGGLKPANGFFTACRTLKKEGKLVGIAVWSADDSRKLGFRYETQAQKVLA